MLTGSRPGGNGVGFGTVTPRIVDLLYRTRIWAQVIAFISLLGAVALLALAGMVRSQEADGVSSALVVPVLAGFLALVVLLLAVPLYRFARTVQQITPSNRGPSVASAFEHLGSFWRRVGMTAALFMVLAIGGGLFVVRARSDPRLAGWITRVLDQHGSAPEERRRDGLEGMWPSRLTLRPARFDRSSPLWSSTPNPPKAPGRVLTFDQIGEACPVADASFLCLLNRPGEEFGEGDRQVLTGGDAHFELLPISYHEGDREYLKVTVEWGPTKEMSLGLGPPRGFPLMKMTYGRATNTGLGGVPFISFSKSSDASCSGNGKFRIVDLVWGADGLPDRLVADFEQECGEHPPVIGRLSIQAGS